MPVCVLCESETFDSIDGLYFCQSCGTQSQVNVNVIRYIKWLNTSSEVLLITLSTCLKQVFISQFRSMSASPCVDAVAHDFAMFGLLSNEKMRNIVKTYLLNTTSFSNP